MKSSPSKINTNSEKINIKLLKEIKAVLLKLHFTIISNSTLDSTKYEQFKLGGKTFQIIFCPIEDGSPLEFHASSENTFDIYIWESMKEKLSGAGYNHLRIALSHELAEIFVDDLGDDNPHETAILYENEIAKILLLTEEEKAEYQYLSDKIRNPKENIKIKIKIKNK